MDLWARLPSRLLRGPELAFMLYREQLDKAHCSTPGCNHKTHDELWLHAACHTGEGVVAKYSQGQLSIYCRRCKKLVVEIAVAAERSVSFTE